MSKPELDLPYYNSTSYPLAVREQLAQLSYDEAESEILKYHQFIVKEFFTRHKSQRGILVMHGMGQGKTRLAVSIADYFKTIEPKRRIVVLLSKSLEGNFRNTIISYTKQDPTYVEKNYRFISMNASNMFKQINTVDKEDAVLQYEKKLGDFMKDVQRNEALHDALLIIDEAHNLFNAITNGSKNATALYDLILNSKRIKLIFLTGTPIINDPFELVPCFNMLRGKMVYEQDPTAHFTGGGEDDDGSDQTTQEELEHAELEHRQDEQADQASQSDQDEQANQSDQADQASQSDQDEQSSQDEQSDQDDQNTTLATIATDLDKRSTLNSDTRNSKDKHDKAKHSKTEHNKAEHNKAKHSKDKHDKRFGKNTKRPHKETSELTLFSEDYDEFAEFFIDDEHKTIRNKDKFMNRIFGLHSYYGDLYYPNKGDKPGFPTRLEPIVERVPMSQFQFATYFSARMLEIDESKQSFRAKPGRFGASKGSNSTYRVKSRQISNYAIPDYALGPSRGAKSREKFIHKITLEDLQQVDKFSPKMGRILQNINKFKNTPGMVYSQFVSGEGLGIFARVLEAHGYVNYETKLIDEYSIGADKDVKRYAILSGAIDPEQRIELINKFNLVENANGSIISLLLLSGAVAEGIDLKRIRHVHIMESFWNYARISQVETRAIRYLSHSDLPEDQRNVQTFIYLSDYPRDYPKSKIKEPTTDVDLYQKSIANMKIIDQFLLALAESSIDCAIHYKNLDEQVKKHISCKMCAPDNQLLFHPLLSRDMQLPNNCKAYKENKITAKELSIDGKKFFYRENPDGTNSLYHFSKKLNGYTIMPRTDPYYVAVMEKIISLVD